MPDYLTEDMGLYVLNPEDRHLIRLADYNDLTRRAVKDPWRANPTAMRPKIRISTAPMIFKAYEVAKFTAGKMPLKRMSERFNPQTGLSNSRFFSAKIIRQAIPEAWNIRIATRNDRGWSEPYPLTETLRFDNRCRI